MSRVQSSNTVDMCWGNITEHNETLILEILVLIIVMAGILCYWQAVTLKTSTVPHIAPPSSHLDSKHQYGNIETTQRKTWKQDSLTDVLISSIFYIHK